MSNNIKKILLVGTGYMAIIYYVNHFKGANLRNWANICMTKDTTS